MVLLNAAGAVRYGATTPSRVMAHAVQVWPPGRPYLSPTVGTVTTPSTVLAPGAQTRSTANPADAYWRDVAGVVTVGANPAGTLYPGRIYWAQMEAINRRSFVFPGVVGNYLSLSAPSLPGDIEMVARVNSLNLHPSDYQPIVSTWATPGFLLRGEFGSSIGLYVNTSGGTASATAPHGLGGAMGWVKATRVASTGVITLYSAPDSPTEPTTWTQKGQSTSLTGAMVGNTGPCMVGTMTTGNYPFQGRIARTIVRAGIAGSTVLDVAEGNASSVAAGATSFTAGTGQTVTVAQTAGNQIIQALPDTLVWRFDANDYPAAGNPAAYTDPRGRTWTQTNPAAITRWPPGP